MQYDNAHDRMLSLMHNVLGGKRPPVIVKTITVSSDSEVHNAHKVQQPTSTSLNYHQAVEELDLFKNIKMKRFCPNFDEEKSKVLRRFDHGDKEFKIVFSPMKEWGADFVTNKNIFDYSDDI